MGFRYHHCLDFRGFYFRGLFGADIGQIGDLFHFFSSLNGGNDGLTTLGIQVGRFRKQKPVVRDCNCRAFLGVT